MKTKLRAVVFAALLITGTLQAQVPQLINYGGRVAVGTVNFDGSGQFKFAFVNADGTTTFWSNDGTSTGGSEPTAAVTLPVAKGLYSVLLGNATLPNMTIVPATVFSNSDVRLRVWFSDGMSGFQLMTPDQRIAAVGYAMMAGSAQTAQTVPDGAITSAKIAPGAVGAAQLANGAAAANLGASGQSGVSSGGVVLSATDNALLINAGYTKIGTTLLDVGAPPGRYLHTAVWTGSEMIVWGGEWSSYGDLPPKNGGRYDPAGNSWQAVTTTGAPGGRSGHTAVWTGGEMIVWGGTSYVNTGGRYNPTTNTWTTVTTSGAPTGRADHSAVWTGTEMIVWGGSGVNGYSNNGGRYNPTTGNWTAISTTGAPTARSGHTAVWTGSEMIVWGGFNGSNGSLFFGDGGRYNPTTNTWTAIGGVSSRWKHTAVWTGTEMLIWGGLTFRSAPNTFTYRLDGGRYNPTTNIWTGLDSGPTGREGHTAVWTGTEMIISGGRFNYNQGLDTTTLQDGGRYNPSTGSWTNLANTGEPTARYGHTAVWSGSDMVLWGGRNQSYFNDGGRYNPATDAWIMVPATTLMYLYQKP
jgi:hypothetical protein